MSDAISALAELLIEARTSGQPIESVADALMPPDAASAELVDDRVAELTGWPVLGWKIGCTSQMAQEMLGADGPFAGRVYRIEESGSTIPSTELMVEPLLEGEFAFRFGVDVDPSTLLVDGSIDESVDRAALVGCVDAVLPAIEFVGGRYSQFAGTPLDLIVADAGANSLLVVGEPRTGVDLDSLVEASATMTVDGVETGRGTGAHVLGDPVDALAWLVANLAGRGIVIEAGQVVTTGTATQVSSLPSGSEAVASFDGVGTVTIHRS